MKGKVIWICLCLIHANLVFGQLVFNGGHSHNDYNQKNPLYDALQSQLVSVEADVYYVEGSLLVAHDAADISESKSLTGMYLSPLYQKYLKQGNSMQPIILMIDFKREGEDCYACLKEVIRPYKDMLTMYQDGKVVKKVVTIIISGDRPLQTIKSEKKRYAFVDGRIPDLDNNEDCLYMPLISDDWFEYFKWDGSGEIQKEELLYLKKMINKCHLQNKMIRFWGVPGAGEKALKYWSLFNKLGVNLIGTDAPLQYKKFKELQDNDK